MVNKEEFYKSSEWKKKRAHILRRDQWLDQVALRDGVRLEADTVHHILPLEEWPEYRLTDWNLVSVNSKATHKARLHEKYTGKLTKLGRALEMETAYLHGVKLKSRTLVIGMPGSGKSTWTKKNLGGGICFELDAIASAFRLTTPHSEDPHPGARKMAAALRSGWLQAAEQYADRIFIVRTAPDLKELEETKPDRIVVMTKQYVIRPYKYDPEDYRAQIENVKRWAAENKVPVEEYPPGG